MSIIRSALTRLPYWPTFTDTFLCRSSISTFDLKSSISEIKIEDRSPDEITKIKNIPIAPKGINTINPAFDITPPNLVTGIITELGLLKPPFQTSIDAIFKQRRN